MLRRGFHDAMFLHSCCVSERTRKQNLETRATNGLEDGGKSSCLSVKRSVPFCGLAHYPLRIYRRNISETLAVL